VIKLLNNNSNHSTGTIRTKKTPTKTVRIAVQESNEEIVTNVNDNTTGKKSNNKRRKATIK